MNKTQISAKVVADSLDPRGNRLTSLLITFPRIILAEINTHRMLSKNTSSSRAIPFNKMVEAVQNNPFIPIAWQKEHKGMQGSEYITDFQAIESKNRDWITASKWAISQAGKLHFDEYGMGRVTKQLCNRLLEPFMWTTMLITGSKEAWQNFFELRCPQYRPVDITYKSKRDAIENEDFEDVFEESDTLGWLSINEGQAEIHMMALAEAIYDVMNESTPKQLQSGDWHIPFEDKINTEKCKDIILKNLKERGEDYGTLEENRWGEYINFKKVQISTALSARTSYTVVGDEKEVNYQKMIELHDRLVTQNPPHSSPMEHCARAMSDEEYYSNVKGEIPYVIQMTNTSMLHNGNNHKAFGWCRNFRGFISYRHIIETNKNLE